MCTFCYLLAVISVTLQQNKGTVECTLFTKTEVSLEKASEMTSSSSQAFQVLLGDYNTVEQND